MSYYRNHLPLSGASGQSTGYTIDQSIRFNDGDSAYMHRTPSSGGNRDKWTWSVWVKRANLTDANATLFQAGADSQTSNYTTILFNGNSGGAPTLKFNSVISSSTVLNLVTTQYFRDVSAWYHIVCVYDSGNVVSSERARIYLNGVRITSFGTQTYPSQNQDSMTNHTVKQSIGRRNQDSSRYMDGYMAEIHLLDGYAYDSSYFGEFKEDTDIWIPKKYTGSYGTNGFYIKGENASDLGNDSSGNNNDYTTSGLAANDQVSDTPTNSFCTYNSIQLQSGATLSDGNLDAVSSGSSWRNVHSTIGVSSGKWYWEVKADVINSSQTWIAGIQETSFESKVNYWWHSGYTASSSGIVFGVLDSNYKVTNVTRTSFTHDIAQGDIVQFQLNLDDNELTVLVDGVSKGKIYDITADTKYTPAVCLYSTSSATINFGQEGTFGGTETAGGNSDANGVGNFKYSVPSGYLALCTKNLGS